ncbi:MAG: amino acid dehydrogenase [Waddliaceae bacterium]
MLTIKEHKISGYEKIIEGINPEANLHCFIAIHSTKLGPALGGTRIYPYSSKEAALKDVLRLSKGMTYKSAVVQIGLGGGKSVIIADPKTEKSHALLHAFAEVLNTLKGDYLAAEDVGSNTDDMMVIREKSPYVAALPTKTSSGDPSPYTARGVFKGMQAVADHLWGHPSLRNKKILIQGLGHVGAKLSRILFWEGAELIVSDVDQESLEKISMLEGAVKVDPSLVFDVECDIFSPCALGGVLNKETISRLKCKAVAGSANNQLEELEDGARLYERGILYAPDFIINSGGIINASAEYEPKGYDPRFSRDKVNGIYDTLLEIFRRSDMEHKPTSVVAKELAEYYLKEEIGKRKHPIHLEEESKNEKKG